MTSATSSSRVCVIGAGPSGLAAVKALRDCGVDCVCFEREDDVGGNWYFGKPGSSVYSGTHLISSKRLTEFADFPMPGDYAPFPKHTQALSYLRSYASAFGLYDNIECNSSVERVEPLHEGGWHVHVAGQSQPQHAERIIVANGHHWSPRWPEFHGEFSGEMIHAHDFKSPEVLEGKRVLVIGAGNSGCDIAVEAAQHASAAYLSVRRGYHYLPKFLRGRPIDSAGIRLQRLGLPLWLRRLIAGRYVNLILGSPQRFGLPKPDHKLFETHPIINSQLFYFLGHGRLFAKENVERLEGNDVVFADGTSEQIDLIVCATGYDVRFPFLDDALLDWEGGLPRLQLHAIHPRRDDLFVVGMIQPNGGIWPLAELQAKLIAHAIRQDANGQQGTKWLRKEFHKVEPRLDGGIDFLDSPRHKLEVDYHTFRKQLSRILAATERRSATNVVAKA